MEFISEVDVNLVSRFAALEDGKILMVPQNYYQEGFYLSSHQELGGGAQGIKRLSDGLPVDGEDMFLLFSSEVPVWVTSIETFAKDSKIAFDEYFDEDDFSFEEPFDLHYSSDMFCRKARVTKIAHISDQKAMAECVEICSNLNAETEDLLNGVGTYPIEEILLDAETSGVLSAILYELKLNMVEYIEC